MWRCQGGNEVAAARCKSVKLLNDVLYGPLDKSRRRCVAGVFEQHTVVAQKASVLQRAEHAAVSVDAGKEQRGGVSQAQNAVEFVVPKTAESVFVDGDVIWRHRQLLNHLGTPITGHQRSTTLLGRAFGIAHADGAVQVGNLAFELHHWGEVEPVGPHTPVQPQNRATRCAPNWQQRSNGANRLAHRSHVDALLSKPSFWVTKVILHIHHHQHTAHHIERYALRQCIEMHHLGRLRGSNQIDTAFAQLPGVALGRTKRLLACGLAGQAGVCVRTFHCK